MTPAEIMMVVFACGVLLPIGLLLWLVLISCPLEAYRSYSNHG